MDCIFKLRLLSCLCTREKRIRNRAGLFRFGFFLVIIFTFLKVIRTFLLVIFTFLKTIFTLPFLLLPIVVLDSCILYGISKIAFFSKTYLLAFCFLLCKAISHLLNCFSFFCGRVGTLCNLLIVIYIIVLCTIGECMRYACNSCGHSTG